jgi:hypothetical protein
MSIIDESTITLEGNTIHSTKCTYTLELVTYFKLSAKELSSISKATYKRLDAILIKKQIKQLDMILRDKDQK